MPKQPAKTKQPPSNHHQKHLSNHLATNQNTQATTWNYFYILHHNVPLFLVCQNPKDVYFQVQVIYCISGLLDPTVHAVPPHHLTIIYIIKAAQFCSDIMLPLAFGCTIILCDAYCCLMHLFSFYYNRQAYLLLHTVLICCTCGPLIPACVVVGLTTNQSGGGSLSRFRTAFITRGRQQDIIKMLDESSVESWDKIKAGPPAFSVAIQTLLLHDSCSSGESRPQA